jgi:hypothetical protein
LPTVTLATLRARVYSHLEDNTAFYTQAEVDGAINDAIRVLNLFTGFVQATGTVTSNNTGPIYSVPTNILIPTRVAFLGRPLARTAFRTMGQSRRFWMRESTETEQSPVERWIPMGLTKFAIHPYDAVGNRTMTVTGIAEPTLLVNTTDEAQYPSEFQDALETYAAHVVMVKAGGMVTRGGMMQYQAFLSRMRDLRRYVEKINPVFFVEAEQEQ